LWEDRKSALGTASSVIVPWSIEDELRLFTEEKGGLTGLGMVSGNAIKLPRCLTQEECSKLADVLGVKSEPVLNHGKIFEEFEERDPSYCFGWLSSIDRLVLSTPLNISFP